jgi:hypothetical protein
VNTTANAITNQTHNVNDDNNNRSQIDLKLYISRSQALSKENFFTKTDPTTGKAKK